VRARFAELAARVSDETGTSRAAEAVAEGFLKIAVENMANAIKKISVQRGWVASKREPEGEQGGGRRGGRAVRRVSYPGATAETAAAAQTQCIRPHGLSGKERSR